MTVATRITKEDMLAGRLVVYSDLAHCFYYPAKPVMDLLTGEMEARLPYYELLDLNPRPHLNAIQSWMLRHDGQNGFWLELQKEYTRLFVNARPKVEAHPYGSLYLEKDGLLWGLTTVEAVKLYIEAGLKMAEDFKDVPDHFATELEFMWYLVREELKASGGITTDEAAGVDMERAGKMAYLQKTFLRKHIGAWYEKFLQKVIASGRSVFYTETSLLAREFLAGEVMRLDE